MQLKGRVPVGYMPLQAGQGVRRMQPVDECELVVLLQRLPILWPEGCAVFGVGLVGVHPMAAVDPVACVGIPRDGCGLGFVGPVSETAVVIEVKVGDHDVGHVGPGEPEIGQGAVDRVRVMFDGKAGGFVRGPFGAAARIDEDDSLAFAVEGEEGSRDEADAVLIVGLGKAAPEDSGDDAEHGSTVEPKSACDDGIEFEVAYL